MDTFPSITAKKLHGLKKSLAFFIILIIAISLIYELLIETAGGDYQTPPGGGVGFFANAVLLAIIAAVCISLLTLVAGYKTDSWSRMDTVEVGNVVVSICTFIALVIGAILDTGGQSTVVAVLLFGGFIGFILSVFTQLLLAAYRG